MPRQARSLSPQELDDVLSPDRLRLPDAPQVEEDSYINFMNVLDNVQTRLREE